MVHAPEVTDYIKRQATKLDAVSDDIDAVNVLKGQKKVDAAVAAAEEAKKQAMFDDASVFDSEKDKAAFRQYEAACDRVKNFYAVSGNDWPALRDFGLYLCSSATPSPNSAHKGLRGERGTSGGGLPLAACLRSRFYRPRPCLTGAGTASSRFIYVN
jgi:hypothetical protein